MSEKVYYVFFYKEKTRHCVKVPSQVHQASKRDDGPPAALWLATRPDCSKV